MAFFDFLGDYGSAAKQKAIDRDDMGRAWNDATGGVNGMPAKPGSTPSYANNPFFDSSKTDAERAQFAEALKQNAAWQPSVTNMAAANAGTGYTVSPTTIDQTAADQSRAYQMGLMGQLQDASMGKGPSVAGMQLQQGLQGSLAAQMAAASSMRGRGNSALAMRNMGNAAAGMQSQTSMAAAQMRAQEALAARSQLAGLSTAARGQDLSVAGQQAALTSQQGMFNAGARNQMALANAGFQQGANQFNAGSANQASLQGQALKNAYSMGVMGMGQNADFNDYNRAIQGKYFKNGLEDKYYARDREASDRQAATGAAVAQTFGTMAMGLSDERLKKNVKPADEKLSRFYEAINAHSYEYKRDGKGNPFGGDGEYVSPMAQELEGTDLGKSMVKDTPDGKVVDYGKGFGAMLAGQAFQFREQKALRAEIEDLKRALKRK